MIDSKLEPVLAYFSVKGILEQVFVSYWWAFLAICLWLAVTLVRWTRPPDNLIFNARSPRHPHRNELATLPIMAVSLAAVLQIAEWLTSWEVPTSSQLSFVWLMFAVVTSGIAVTLALVVVAACLAWAIYRVPPFETIRLGLPGLASLGSLALIWLTVWGVFQAFQLSQ
jgi:cation transport ATPase